MHEILFILLSFARVLSNPNEPNPLPQELFIFFSIRWIAPVASSTLGNSVPDLLVRDPLRSSDSPKVDLRHASPQDFPHSSALPAKPLTRFLRVNLKLWQSMDPSVFPLPFTPFFCCMNRKLDQVFRGGPCGSLFLSADDHVLQLAMDSGASFVASL